MRKGNEYLPITSPLTKSYLPLSRVSYNNNNNKTWSCKWKNIWKLNNLCIHPFSRLGGRSGNQNFLKYLENIWFA